MEVRDRKVEALAWGCLRLQDARGSRAGYLPPPHPSQKKERKKARKEEEKKRGKKHGRRGNLGMGRLLITVSGMLEVATDNKLPPKIKI